MIRTFFLLLTVLSLTSCNKENWFCGDCIDYDYNGTDRQYLIHVPENLPSNAPLVFALHGYTGYAKHVDKVLNMNQLADLYGFVVCYPQGSLDRISNPHWNARLDLSETDDIGFLSALAITLQGQYDLDPERTYTSGISNGGFMSYTLVAEAPQVFKAAASIIGTMSGYTWENRNSIQPAPILQVTGTGDNVVPSDGSMSTNDGWGGAPDMHTVMDFWVGLNECVPTDTLSISPITTAYTYTDTTNNNHVWYYEVAGMGHEVPDGGNKGFSSGELIWEFFTNL